METNRTVTSETALATPAISRTEADPRSGCPDRDPVCAPQRHSLADAAAANGLRLGRHLLAPPLPLAALRGLETTPRRAPGGVAPTGPTRFGPRYCRQFVTPRAARGEKTGPNPTDRRKAGSKHHVLTDAHGIPLVATLTAANRNDITELLPLVDAMPPVRGRVGRPYGNRD